jgi:hypothetical protein
MRQHYADSPASRRFVTGCVPNRFQGAGNAKLKSATALPRPRKVRDRVTAYSRLTQ